MYFLYCTGFVVKKQNLNGCGTLSFNFFFPSEFSFYSIYIFSLFIILLIICTLLTYFSIYVLIHL